MDLVLKVSDDLLFDRLYDSLIPSQNPSGFKSGSSFNHTSDTFPSATSWPRDDIWRQSLSLYLLACFFGSFIYLFCATLSYFLVFDKRTFQHPKYIPNQIRLEITQALRSIPFIAVMTAPVFVLEVRGYSKLYGGGLPGPGLWYDIAQFPLFIIFTDFCIYWIHRFLHHPFVYKHVHKPHHKWIVPTPFASVAFHPLDGFMQSLPYHVYPFLFPLQRISYLVLFAFVQVWTVLIHDGDYYANNLFINGAACHTMHHLYFNYNYGQFTTFWDRIGGSYRKPDDELFVRDKKMDKKVWEKQAKETDRIEKIVDGKKLD